MKNKKNLFIIIYIILLNYTLIYSNDTIYKFTFKNFSKNEERHDLLNMSTQLKINIINADNQETKVLAFKETINKEEKILDLKKNNKIKIIATYKEVKIYDKTNLDNFTINPVSGKSYIIEIEDKLINIKYKNSRESLTDVEIKHIESDYKNYIEYMNILSNLNGIEIKQGENAAFMEDLIKYIFISEIGESEINKINITVKEIKEYKKSKYAVFNISAELIIILQGIKMNMLVKGEYTMELNTSREIGLNLIGDVNFDSTELKDDKETKISGNGQIMFDRYISYK